MRRPALAHERGLDPNNVELVTAEKISVETTTNVRNIFEYDVAYKLTHEQTELQKKLRKQVEKGS